MIYGFATSPCLAGRGVQRSEKECQQPGEAVAVILVRDDSGVGKGLW